MSEGQTLVERIVRRGQPEHTAVVSPDGTMSYAQLLRRAHGLAALLADRSSPVLVYGHKQPAMVVSILAALLLERPYVPVDPSAPPARVARLIDLARPGDVVLAQQPPVELASALRERHLPTHAIGALAEDVERAGPAGDSAVLASPTSDEPEIPAYILFTSGTTGDPKGVPVPRRGLAHFVDWLLETQRFAVGAETFLNQAPFSFDLSVMDLYGALLTGGTLFCVTRDEIAEPRRLFARLDGAPITVWVSTPSFARFCIAEPSFRQGRLPALRRFLFCGETLPPGLAAELVRRFPEAQVWNTYGPTETTVAVTAVQITPALAASGRPLPVGRPAPGMEVWVADPANPTARRADGEAGEIVIAGPQVALGYLQAGGGPAAVGPFFSLPDGRRAYRTGDRGHVDPADGLLYCDGRLDRQIKLHGYRLELAEIEAHLRAVPGVADSAVLAIERDGQPDYLAAFVVPDAASSAALPASDYALGQHLRAALSRQLPDYALPRLFRRLPALPLTNNGKLDQQRLARMLR